MSQQHLEERLKQSGIALPAAPQPLGAYIPAVQVGTLLFVSGMVPVVNGKPYLTGRLGAERTVEDGQEGARIAGLNALAVAKSELGSLDRLKRAVRLNVIQLAIPEFTEHAKVADSVSDLFGQLFGAENSHTRSVQGAASLPGGYTVILEVIFEITA
ncbi:RidA family protein [Leptolyngbya sp. FACHB-261]|uniref:RidA family protein n=1 Tax=Leptolyngbya sp. FACHB-261 TaxID=2692806 RepID=UPI001686B11C|nr:RidA family protein [Leptolyngbya sp. FACHB-261]MBD2102413.1 RidA family protein [Leptolyngbya sp. FACHB-261]